MYLMSDQSFRVKILVIFSTFVLLAFAWLPQISPAAGSDTELKVHFLDVGQGDAIFIESPTGVQLLIDGGRGSDALRELGEVMDFFDRDIDYVLMTHPDADHVGGLAAVFDRYVVDHVIRTNNESDTNAWTSTEGKVDEEGSTVDIARRGQVYDLGAGVKLSILFPDRDMSEAESNASSIVARLSYGDIDFLFTGDSPKGVEEYLVLVEGENLASEVLKVGHHGSRTSTSELFLDEVQPEYAVISAGKDNRYGHPHVKVTDLLFNKRVKMFSTAESGRITFYTDGFNLDYQTE